MKPKIIREAMSREDTAFGGIISLTGALVSMDNVFSGEALCMSVKPSGVWCEKSVGTYAVMDLTSESTAGRTCR